MHPGPRVTDRVLHFTLLPQPIEPRVGDDGKRVGTAYVMSPGATEGGLFVVRVGSYPQRDAERVEATLRDQEKFRPYIVKN